MSQAAGGGGRVNRIRLSLAPEETGTLLGACAWVLGALEILKDRGHAAEQEALHELHDGLAPAVNRLAALAGGARGALGADQETQEAIEEAFGRVRSAFERWIEVTAADTMAAALEQRLEEIDGQGGELPRDGDAATVPGGDGS